MPPDSQKEFEGKRVVIVGMSHTGCDIAVDLTGIAAKVFLSHRAGSRIVSRPNSHLITLLKLLVFSWPVALPMEPRLIIVAAEA